MDEYIDNAALEKLSYRFTIDSRSMVAYFKEQK
jgi:hypothetical protein